MLAEIARNAACKAVTDLIAYVEVFSESGRLFTAPVQAWGEVEAGARQTQLQAVAQATGSAVEVLAFASDGQPLVRDTTAEWSFSRPQIQQGAKVTVTWTYTQP